MKHRLYKRFLSCFLCVCLIMNSSLPAAAVQSDRGSTTETPQTEPRWEAFEDVPVGDPVGDGTSPSSGDRPTEMPETPAEGQALDETTAHPSKGQSETMPESADPDSEDLLPGTPSNAPSSGQPGGQLPEAVPLAARQPAVLELEGVSYILIDTEEELRKIGSGDIVPGTEGGLDKHHYFKADEDYAIVADIGLTKNWTPLDFCGTMIGAKVVEKEGVLGTIMYSLEDLGPDEERTISNIEVTESGSKHGVGFFGALYSKGIADEMEKDSGGSGGIIGGILGGLVGLVGGLLGTITGLLGDVAGLLVGWTDVTALGFEKVEVRDLVLDDITLPDVTTDVPVGAFAGQISGNVEVTNCHVRNVLDISGKQCTGGFVGKTMGATSYLLHGTLDGLNGLLGGLGSILDSVLNILLPTEDLVGNLIEKLGVDKLIPVGYDPAVLTGCTVSFAAGSGAVSASERYAGGFAGRLQGTRLAGCSVSGIGSVTALANVGGFAGRINNTPIVGLLQGLGVNLVDFPAGCALTDCAAEGSVLQVTSTQINDGITTNLAYAGGFAGAVMASTVTISEESAKCGVTGLSSVEAQGSYVGGFAGYVGVGDLAEALNLLDKTLDLELKGDGTLELGSAVTELLNKVLGVNLDAGVLSLIGLHASQLAGCSVEGTDYTVTGDQRVGGFVGYLQGGQIVEEVVERQYSRTQLKDAAGDPVYVPVSDIVDDGVLGIGGGDLISGVYGRLADGKVILEDVHGNPWKKAAQMTDITGKTVYHVYDSIHLDEHKDPVHSATFRNADWSAVLRKDKPVSNQHDLPDRGHNAVVPVYQQVTNSKGQVRFTYYSDTGAQIVYRDNENTDQFYHEDGSKITITGTEGLASDTLQMAVEDQIGNSGTVTAQYRTEIRGLSAVSGNDYVGGAVGQAALVSAVDLLSNLTAVQYERFELNHVALTGADDGYTVTAQNGRAGGAVGYAMGGDVVDVNIEGLTSVSAASYAGGFGGQIIPGTVAGQDGSGLKLLGLISVSNLVSVIDAVHTFVSDSAVSGIPSGFTVRARNDAKNAAAGGFVAWSVNSKFTNCTVSGLSAAEADGYAGGFCAVADTGSIAGVLDKTFGSIDIKSLLGLNGVLSLLNAFPNRFRDCTVNGGDSNSAYSVSAVPEHVSKVPGERVNAQDRSGTTGTACGSAGGFLGYGTAVQVENCANENLATVDATSYAGGFGGYVTIGSVAQLGSAGILGDLASVTGIASLLDCAVSILKTSHAQGASGGCTITAFDRVVHSAGGWTDMGMAGGFIGNFEGSHIEGCYANHVNAVRGEEYAGGFIGRMVPGDVARAAEGAGGILDAIIKLNGGLLSALQTMVPSVKNSYAKCVPCGGTVLSYGSKQEGLTGDITQTGVAGGYVGLNSGGQIWGSDEKAAQVTDRSTRTADHSGNAVSHETAVYGTGQTCDILQLLKVDASHYAGGYSGYTRAADLASLGNISLLGGLVDLGQLLSVGQVVVPTQRNTGVTGPLRNVTQAQMEYLNQKNVDQRADFSQYYGYTVGHNGTEASGGYCGVMTTGVVEHSIAYDLISAEAVQQSGGFVGAMLTGGVAQADLGSSLLGGLVSGVESITEQLFGVVNAIVPVIKTSGVYGCSSGSQVIAHNGSAGGFAGAVRGGQIWGEADPEEFAEDISPLVHTYSPVSSHCFTKHLRSVTASGALSDAGGFAGSMSAVSVASLGGLGLLGDLIKLPDNFLRLVSATVPTVYYADVSAADDWGFYVDGEGGRSAGGFAGLLQGAQVGSKTHPDRPALDPDAVSQGTNITVSGLRSVTAGDYAGGFFGYADAADTLNVSGADEGGSSKQFTLLQLLTVGEINALELAKSYIYNSSVSGIPGGYQVSSTNGYAWKSAEWNGDEDKAACSGGFGGLLQAGVVRFCSAKDLSLVSSENYAGGFVARMGKSSILKAGDVATTDKLGILGDLLGLSAGVGDVFGSHIQDSSLAGTAEGCAVLAQGGWHEIAGGFVGYADVCRIKNCAVTDLGLVMSDEIAGGFMGAMSDAMLLSLDVGLLKRLLEGVQVHLDLIKANRSKVENATVTGVASWDGYDVYGGGSGPNSDANTTMGYAGAFLGLNFGSTVTEGNSVYADTVKGTVNRIDPYVGTEENSALLVNLDLDVLLKLLDIDGWLSKSEVVHSTFQTRTGNTEKPDGVTPVGHDGTEHIAQLQPPFYVDADEADLMVPTVTHTLTVTKELQYEDGAIPNLGDLNYVYTIQIYGPDTSQIHTVSLHPGESVVLDNPAAGTYTIKETAASVLPGNIIPAQETTVTVTAGENSSVTIVNVVRAAPVPEGDGGGHAAGNGKFIVNHIPTGGQEPGVIENPCEVLNDVAGPSSILYGLAGSPGMVVEKRKENEEKEDADGR